jgi:hypothetical protein
MMTMGKVEAFGFAAASLRYPLIVIVDSFASSGIETLFSSFLTQTSWSLNTVLTSNRRSMILRRIARDRSGR